MLRTISMRLSRSRAAACEAAHNVAGARARPPSEEEWAALCRSQVFPYALRRLGQAQDAEDIAVETLTAALASRERFERFGGRVEPRLWLLGIARRKIADAQRQRSRRIQPDASDLAQLEMGQAPARRADEPESLALRDEALAQLRGLVRALPEPQREALLLQAIEGLSIGEIAQVMNRSASAVNSLLGRARETIRRRGAKYFGGDQ